MQVVPITSAEMKERIHQTYRMGYIKDVILPRVSATTLYLSLICSGQTPRRLFLQPTAVMHFCGVCEIGFPVDFF